MSLFHASFLRSEKEVSMVEFIFVSKEHEKFFYSMLKKCSNHDSKTSINELSKAVSNIIANAIAYIEKRKMVCIYRKENALVIEKVLCDQIYE